MSSALDMQRERAAMLARDIVARAPAGSIQSVFAGGSLGRGEVWAADIDGCTEIYSDVDLYVVAENDSQAGGIRTVVTSVEERSPAGVSFLRPADIGVYTRGDLAAQPLRPGTAGLGAHHLMLYGDESIPRALAGRDTARISRSEALYLLENRAMELSGGSAAEGTPAARLALAQALKARLDVYSAHAIVAGTFASTLAERARRFHENPPASLTGDARTRVADAFAAARDVRAWVRTRAAGVEREQALAAVAEAWHALASSWWREEGDSPAALVRRRCQASNPIANARDILRIRRRLGQSRGRSPFDMPVLLRFSPITALRVYSLTRVLATRENDARAYASYDAYVDRLTRSFGFTNGTLDARTRAMHAALS